MQLLKNKPLRIIKSYFSTEKPFDLNILSEFMQGDALTPSVKKPEKKESTTIKLYFNLADNPFDNQRDVPLIAIALKAAIDDVVIKPEIVYQFHLYLLISGKKANVLPRECKTYIQNALDHLNKMDTKIFSFSALSRTKKKYENMKNQLSKILTSAQFSADKTNDTLSIKSFLEKMLKKMMEAESLKDLPVKTFIIAKRIGDAVIKEDDIFINSTYKELTQIINKSPKTVKATPKALLEKSKTEVELNKTTTPP